VEETLHQMENRHPDSIGEVLQIDEESRRLARRILEKRAASQETRPLARA